MFANARKWLSTVLPFLFCSEVTSKKRKKEITILSIAATLIGTHHRDRNGANEDFYGTMSLDGRYAFFVVDGAGGEKNGRLAAQEVTKKIIEYLRENLASWSTVEETLNALKILIEESHLAARKVEGMAAVLIYVVLPNHHWACARVADCVLIGRDSKGNWSLPIQPLKISLRRCITFLLGGDDGFEAIYASGQKCFESFVLASDWVCGNTTSHLLIDMKPNAALGEYKPNARSLNWMIDAMSNGKTLKSDGDLEQLMLGVQRNEVPQIAFSKDDMTLIIGVVS